MIKEHLKEGLVVVIGGAGYIGSLLTRKLLAEHYRVRVFDNFLFGRSGIEDIESPHVELVEGDICNTADISAAISGAETVILLAAIVGRRAKDIERPNMREVNFLASTVVLDASIEHGVNRFIFASTDSIYGVQSGVMYETTTPDPVSLYSRLKLRFEERVINSRKKTFHPTALRIATCYGFSPRMRFDLVLNGLVRDAVCKKEIEIEGGEQVRSLVHVDDVARAILCCVKAHVNLISGEVFNVGPKKPSVKVNELANLVKSYFPEIQVHFKPGEADLVDYQLSTSKIAKILDFNPRLSLQDCIAEVRERLISGTFGDPFDRLYENT